MIFEEKASLAELKPSQFAQSVYLIDGQDFRLNERDYLLPIYDTRIPQGLLKCGRQVEKSTTASVKMANSTLLTPFNRTLYVAPRNEQVKSFSKSRLGKLFRYSKKDFVKDYYMQPDLSDQVFMKEFTNGSEIYLRHCYDEGDNIRGITTIENHIDEVQDILVDAIPVIAETQSHYPETRRTWYYGTPKSFSNTIEQLWGDSKKYEWIIQCSRCNTYQIMGVENLTPDSFVCRKCKEDLSEKDRADGFWKALNPEGSIYGFHISQLMVPWITARDVWTKYITYPPAKFYNEVLGLSYEVADKPVTETLWNELCDDSLSMYGKAEGEFANKKTYIGVDWGTGEESYTAATVFAYNDNGLFQNLYTKFYTHGKEMEPDYQVNHISSLMKLFKVDFGLLDWGFGFTQNKQLISRFGKRLAQLYYTHNQKDVIRWDGGHSRYTVRRSDVLYDYVNLLQNHEVVFPNKVPSDLRMLKDHHLAEQIEYRTSFTGKSEEMFFTHPLNQPDDGFHASSSAYLASKIHRPQSGGLKFAGVKTS